MHCNTTANFEDYKPGCCIVEFAEGPAEGLVVNPLVKEFLHETAAQVLETELAQA